MGYRFQLVRLSVRPSVRLSVRLSVTIYPTHFVDTTSTLPAGPIETGPVLYESQDIEPWPRQGHVSIAPKTRLWRVAKVDEKYFFSHRLNMGELNVGENTRFYRIVCCACFSTVELTRSSKC